MTPCAVRGCTRAADTEVEGEDNRTGAPLPSQYVCDDPEHQYAVALAMLPADQPAPPDSFGAQVRRDLAIWNAIEATERPKGGPG